MSGRRHDGDGVEAGDPAELRGALDVPITADILERALTHRSYAYENGGLPTNERLEFLGDSVLSLVVTTTLYNGHPDLPEGHLAKLRAAVVQMTALAEVARGLNLGSYVKLGRGEEGTGGRDKPSILADTLEAVIGASYVACGLDAASDLVHRLFDPVIARSAMLGAGLDWKTSLQELTADRSLGVPEYMVKDSGPDHQKLFHAIVKVGSRELGAGEGRSKKAAEQLAAQVAYRSITADQEKEEQAASQRLPVPPAPSSAAPDPENSGAAPAESAGKAGTTGGADASLCRYVTPTARSSQGGSSTQGKTSALPTWWSPAFPLPASMSTARRAPDCTVDLRGYA